MLFLHVIAGSIGILAGFAASVFELHAHDLLDTRATDLAIGPACPRPGLRRVSILPADQLESSR